MTYDPKGLSIGVCDLWRRNSPPDPDLIGAGDTGTYREVSCFPLIKGHNLPLCRVLFFINYKEKQLCNDICYAIRFLRVANAETLWIYFF